VSEIGERALDEARRWIGTPYVHQASKIGAGCDCLGLLRGVWRALYDCEPEVVPAYTEDWSEASGEERLWAGALRHLRPIEMRTDATTGEILLFRMRVGSVAKHLGMRARIGGQPTFIHAYSGHGVIESSLSPPWARRVVARFNFPEGA
jgi:NlpC/P60 family putative phage cell wall peptidase